MTRLRIRTASRLHFGLLGWGPEAGRQFGGVGLMVEDPGIAIEFESSPEWKVVGPLATRVAALVQSILNAMRLPSTVPPLRPPAPARVEVVSAAPEHAGLGVGTQLSLAIVEGLFKLDRLGAASVEQLAFLTGRGRRSGVGLHGFRHGGLIVDGGHSDRNPSPPLVARMSFPDEWSILLVQPPGPTGRHGTEEARLFSEMPPLPDGVTERLCRLVLLGILPAVAECDLDVFGAALSELQHHVGQAFAPSQGGHYASSMSGQLVKELGGIGLVGIGQSSWGPTLYAFGKESDSERERICRRVRDRFGLEPSAVRWTRAANHGAVLEYAES
jgi:beta-RFAP synthase